MNFSQIMTLVALLVFFGIMVIIGLFCRRQANTVEGFVLGGRKAGPWLTAFAYGTSYFSAVIFVGYAGQFGWNFGVASTWIGLGNAFIGSLLAWEVLGRRTRLMTQALGSRTMPDFFEHRYGSRTMKIVASVIIFVFLIPYTASLFNGLSRLFSMAFPGIDYAVCVIVMAVLTGIYVIAGGYMATAINDFVQGIVMLVGITAVVIAVLNQHGGLTSSLIQLSSIESEGWEAGAYSSFLGPNPIFLLFVVLLTSLGTWGLPQMVGKFYAIRNEDDVKKGTIISTVFAIIVAGGCYFLGGFGRLFLSQSEVDANGYDSIIPTMLQSLSPVLIAIVLILVLSASMSTLSSLVLTSSSTMTLDLIAPSSKKGFSEKKKVIIMRLFVAFFILISAVIAIVQAKSKVLLIAQFMGISWGAISGAFLAPFLYGLYWKRTTKSACFVSFIFGVSCSIIQLIKSLTGFSFGVAFLDNVMFKTSLHSGVFAMVIGLIIVPVVSLLSKKPDQERVGKLFSCYDKKVTVEAKDSLGD